LRRRFRCGGRAARLVVAFAVALAAVPSPPPALCREGPPGGGAPGRAAKTTSGRSGVGPETAASWHARRGLYFQRNWGIDIIGVRRVSSGLMLRFDYRVVDPSRATGLNDRKARPYLIDEATRTALAVPAMENIGELRQMSAFEANRTYFMIFGNPGALVQHGGRVTLVVGDLRAEGLVVD
jgi:hypothetical protein